MKSKRLKYLFFYLLILLSGISAGQSSKQTIHTNFVWVNEYLKIKLNDKWNFYFDASYRTKDWLNHWNQVKLNPGLTYNVNTKISATAGFAYFLTYNPHYLISEYRPWEQIQYTHVILPRVYVSHRIRVEQRLNQKVVTGQLTNDFAYNNRYRYQLGLKIFLSRDTAHVGDKTIHIPRINSKAFYIIISDEIMMNSGKEIVYNTFDQNRITGGLGYKLNKIIDISVTYMNTYIQKNTKNTFENNNVIVLNFYQNF